VTQPLQIIDETPDYLMGLYKDKTDVQGRAASGLYVGRGLKYRDLSATFTDYRLDML